MTNTTRKNFPFRLNSTINNHIIKDPKFETFFQIKKAFKYSTSEN